MESPDMKRLLFIVALLSPAYCVAENRCASLQQNDCFKSTDCWLDCGVPVGKNGRCMPYVCREKTECEKGIQQAGLKKELCEARSNCEYQQPSCYCPEGAMCYCGGGPPAQCKPK